MARTVTILFDNRAEAETARERLAAELDAQQTRIIGKDTIAALDGLELDSKYAFTLRHALRQGGQVVIAEVPSGTTAERVLQSVGLSSDTKMERDEAPVLPPLRYGIEKRDGDLEGVSGAPGNRPPLPVDEPTLQRTQPRPEPVRMESGDAAPTPRVSPSRSMALGANGTAYRALSEDEADAAGLFKERTIDFAEMREEAIVTKEAIVREEVIVTKTVKERTETIRDTVRRTAFEVEQLDPR